MSKKKIIALNLAAAFLAGNWTLPGLVARAKKACGSSAKWLRPLIQQLLADIKEHPGEHFLYRLARGIERHPIFQAYAPFTRKHVFRIIPKMRPENQTAATWQAPALTTSTALAEWAGLMPAELDWFADCHGHEARAKPGPLRHYSYRWIRKSSSKWRLLEMPKTRLKAVQRRILREVLNRIPPHDAAHGCREKRSIATFAAPHCGQRIVLRFDLRDFFPSVPASRVHAVFATAGYPPEVARYLTGLCVNVVAYDVWRSHPGDQDSRPSWNEQQRFRSPHLPQGAPTSPALANLCAYRLDCRLDGLAKSLGARYSRYVDDLAFSGGRELERSLKRFQVMVCRIALEEGFEIHLRKLQVMRQAVCQQLLGVVVNAHLNVRRASYDQLKAILNNCKVHGPESQNRDGHNDFRSHLLGSIAHVTMLNHSRGQRLKAIFEQIRWENTSAQSHALE